MLFTNRLNQIKVGALEMESWALCRPFLSDVPARPMNLRLTIAQVILVSLKLKNHYPKNGETPNHMIVIQGFRKMTG